MRRMKRSLAPLQVLTCRFCQVCSFSVLVLLKMVQIDFDSFSFAGPVDAVTFFSGDMSTEVDVRQDRR